MYFIYDANMVTIGSKESVATSHNSQEEPKNKKNNRSKRVRLKYDYDWFKGCII